MKKLLTGLLVILLTGCASSNMRVESVRITCEPSNNSNTTWKLYCYKQASNYCPKGYITELKQSDMMVLRCDY